MKRIKLTRVGRALALLGALVLLGPVTATFGAADVQDRAALEKQLADARERLDAAARDVAELSGRLYGGQDLDIVRFVHDEPRGAMLGVNIGNPRGRDDGVEIVGVSPGGPAERAGLRAGDVITAVDGKAMRRDGERSPGSQLVAFMRTVEPGQTVKVDYLRGGKPQSAAVETTRAEPAIARVMRDRLMLPLHEGMALPPFEELLGAEPSFRSLELVPITPRLGQYFGTDKGLLVVRAPAERGFQLEEGDVLLTIDGRTPESPGHAFRILRSYQPGEKLKLGILRNRKRLDLEVVVPAADGMGGRDPPRHPLPPPPGPAHAKPGPA